MKEVHIMSNKQNLYTGIWRSQSLKIRDFLTGNDQEQVIQLDRTEFERAGNRKGSGYTFNLMLENGRAVNNISGTAVARDLDEYLSDNKLFRDLLKDRKVKINLDSEFRLHLKKL